MPITAETFKKFKKGNVCIETGCLYGDGIQAALDAGFEHVISIELSSECVKRARRRFHDRPVTIIEGDTLQRLPAVLTMIEEPLTLWLDAHPEDSSPILSELALIEQHSVKRHTLLIDDRRMMGKEWGSVTEELVYDAIRKINEQYVITLADGFVPDDIVVAQVLS